MRGYTFAEYHADVYDRTEEEVTIAGRLHARLHKLYFCLYLHFQVTKVGLDCECLGGGRIQHKEAEKYIKVILQLAQL